MNLFGLSPGELILIMFVAMIVLGPEKLPETAASIGRWIREFRRATQELTQQFADDNPFAEIQRALSLTDELSNAPLIPDSSTAGTTAPAVVAPPAAIEVVPSVSTYPAVTAPLLPRSDYFDRPSIFEAIDDRWAHGSLEDFSDRVMRRLKPEIEQAIADEWAHGVPVVAITAPLEPIASNGHGADTQADFSEAVVAPHAIEADVDSAESVHLVEGVVPPPVESERLTQETVAPEPSADPPRTTARRPRATPRRPRQAPTNGISISAVIASESEPVPVGSSGSSSSGEDGGHR